MTTVGPVQFRKFVFKLRSFTLAPSLGLIDTRSSNQSVARNYNAI